MCRLDLIYTPDQLRALSSNDKKTLLALGRKKVKSSEEIRKIIKNDRRVAKTLKRLLRSKFNQLTRA
jgi:thioredoxin-related protein